MADKEQFKECVVVSGSVTYTNEKGNRTHSSEGSIVFIDNEDASVFLKKGVCMTRDAFEKKMRDEKEAEESIRSKSEDATAAMLLAADIKLDKPEKAIPAKK